MSEQVSTDVTVVNSMYIKHQMQLTTTMIIIIEEWSSKAIDHLMRTESVESFLNRVFLETRNCGDDESPAGKRKTQQLRKR